MEPYVDVFKRYFDFEGRTSRNDFWMFVLIHFIIMVVLSMIDFLFLSGLYGLVMIIPTISVTARRLHDTNKSGWWQLLDLIPFVGFLVVLIFCMQPAVEEGNRFGDAVSTDDNFDDIEYEEVDSDESEEK